jgi:hypothetical protein
LTSLLAERGAIERLLPRRAKQVLLPVIVLLIFTLLLFSEDTNATPFLYIGF